MDEIRLRTAVIEDLPGIWEVRYSVTENTLAPGRISDEDLRVAIEQTGRGWVVEDQTMILGFAVGNAETGNVWALFVRPEAQGRGLGTRLHEAMISWFRGQSLSSLWLSTGIDTKARQFYERNGWICTGPHGDSELRYERPNR